jgi:hypothetical protein
MSDDTDETAETVETDDERESLEQAAAVLVQALTEDEALPPTIEAVIGRYSAPGTDSETVSKLGWALNQVVGSPGGAFLAYYLAADDPDSLLMIVEDVASDAAGRIRTLRFMRRVQALYGQAVMAAMRSANASPDDWDGIWRQAYWDAIVQKWRLEARIVKNNGDELNLVFEPDSGARLVGNLLRTLDYVGPEHFGDEARAAVLESISSFLSKFGLSIVGSPLDEDDDDREGFADATADPGRAAVEPGR